MRVSPARTAAVWTDTRGGTLEPKPDGSGRPRSRGNLTIVAVSSDTGAVVEDHEALRYREAPKLWSCIGDPGDGNFCTLTAPPE